MTDLEMNVSSIKTKVFFSEVVEVFACMQLLVIPLHHEFENDIARKISNELSKESKDFLKEINKLQLHGIDLFDFILAVNIHDDFDLFISKLLELTAEEIITIFTYNNISLSNARKIINKQLTNSELENLLSNFYKDSISEIESILYDGKDYIRKLSVLLKEIHRNNHFNNQVQLLMVNYQESTTKLTKELNNIHPLELGQILMNKRFGIIHNYQEFYFTPSYFLSPHKVRIHNESINHVIYDLRLDNAYLYQVTSELSNTMKVLSDRTRLEILRQLSISKSYGKKLANSLDITTATVSHHIELLRNLGFISEERIKNIKFYSLNKQEIESFFKKLTDYLNNKL